MATEYESLRLNVSLVDNVTSQLEKIRGSLRDMGGGAAGAGLERLKRQTRELTEQIKGLAGGFGGGSEAALTVAKSLGLATAGIAAAGVALVKGVQSLNEYTKAMQELGRLSTQTGLGAAQIKEMSEAMQRSGIDAGRAQTNIAGLAHAMADITRVNSQFRQNLLRQAGQGSDRAAMEMLLGDLGRVANDPAAFVRKLQEAQDQIYNSMLARTGSATRAAEARKNFLADIGMPDLAEFRGEFATVSKAAEDMMAGRIAQAREFQTVTTEIGQSWGKIGESIQAFLTPAATAALRPLAEVLRVSAEQIETAMEAMRTFTPPEWLRSLGTELNAIGESVAGVLNRLQAAGEALGQQTRELFLNFQPPEWMTNVAQLGAQINQALGTPLNALNDLASALGERLRAAIVDFQPPEWLTGAVDLGAQALIDGANAAAAALRPLADVFEAIVRQVAAIGDMFANLKAPEWLAKLGGAAAGATGAISGAATNAVDWAKSLFHRGDGQDPLAAAASIPVPAFQAGGAIGAGELGVVGEAGPELFAPGQSGTILPHAIYGAALAAEYGLGVRGASTAAAGALRGHSGAAGGQSIGQVLAGLTPGVGLLQAMKNDAERGHPLRTKLRALLGLEDPGEPAPWQKVATRQTGGPVTAGASYMVGEAGPELFAARGGGQGGGQGARLIAEQNRQVQELNANTEDQNAEMRRLVDELRTLNQAIAGPGGTPGAAGETAGGGGIGASAGGGGLRGSGGVRMGGLGGLPGFRGGGGGGGGGFAGGGGSAGGGGATGAWAGSNVGPGSGAGAGGTGGSEGRPGEGTPGVAGDDMAPAQALAYAQAHLGKNAVRDQNTLSSFFKSQGIKINPATTAWCAAFVNASLSQAGIKGTGSLAAGSFMKYGTEVDPAEVKGGDIAVVRGRSPRTGIEGKHVAFATGETRMGPRGEMQYQVLGGNQGGGRGSVTQAWYSGSQLAFRRPPGGAGAMGGGVDMPATGGQAAVGGAGPPGVGGAPAERLQEKLGISPEQYNIYRETLAGIESGGQYDIRGGAGGHYTGRYQFGKAEIRETAQRLGEAPPTREQFQKDPEMQERYLPKYMEGHHDYLTKNSAKYREASPSGKLAILGYAHNQGAGGASKWLRTNQVGRDAFGTAGTKYSSSLTAALRGSPGRSESAALDRRELDQQMAQEVNHKVEGTGKLTVDVNAPQGTKVAAEGGGLFKKVETNRQTQMTPAAEGPRTVAV